MNGIFKSLATAGLVFAGICCAADLYIPRASVSGASTNTSHSDTSQISTPEKPFTQFDRIEKLKSLGFTDDQIASLLNDKTPTEVKAPTPSPGHFSGPMESDSEYEQRRHDREMEFQLNRLRMDFDTGR